MTAQAVAADGSPVEVYRRLPAEPALSIVRSAVPPGAGVLDLGCGPGRLAHPLLAVGHPVVAVDDSPEMLACVREAETLLADVWRLDLGRRFDAVLAAAHLFDQPDRARKLDLLRVCRRHAAASGVVVLERYPPDWRPGPAAGTLGEVEVRLHDVEAEGHRFSAAVTYAVDGRSWTQRFSASVTGNAELDDLASDAGLRVDRWLDERQSWVLLVPGGGRSR